ncbi:MAG: hypothetical protein HZA54_09945 [Planctomycetes bacterium]|nr:hypothetical protein [Planctomycetota bacterium]
MKSLKLQGEVQQDGILRLEVQSGLAPGPVNILLTVEPKPASSSAPMGMRDLEGLGKEIWHGVDAQAYVDGEREEWAR